MGETRLVNFEESLKCLFDEMNMGYTEPSEDLTRDSDFFGSLEMMAEPPGASSIFPTNFNVKTPRSACKNHPTQMLKVFCNECKISLCVLCAETHVDHNCVDIHQIASLARKELHLLQEQMTEVEEQLMDKLNQQTAFQTQLESLDRKTERGICRHREKLLQNLSMSFELLENSRQNVHEFLMAKLQNENKELTQKMEALRTASRTICHLLLHGSAQETILKYLRHKDQISTLSTTNDMQLTSDNGHLDTSEWKFEPYDLKIHVGTLVLTDSNEMRIIPSNPDFLLERDDLNVQLNNLEDMMKSLEKELLENKNLAETRREKLQYSESERDNHQRKLTAVLVEVESKIATLSDKLADLVDGKNGDRKHPKTPRGTDSYGAGLDIASLEEALARTVEDAESKVNEFAANIGNTLKKKDHDVKDLRCKLEEMEEIKDSLQVERDQLTLKLTKAVGDAEGKIHELTESLSSLQEVKDKESLDLSERIHELGDTIKSLAAEKEEWKRKFDESEELCSEYDHEMGELRDKIFKSDNDLKEKQRDLDEANTLLKEVQEETESAREKLQEAELQLSTVGANVHEMQSKVDQLQDEIKVVSSEKTELERKSETLDREVRIMKFLRAVGGDKEKGPATVPNRKMPQNYTWRRAHYSAGGSFFSRR